MDRSWIRLDNRLSKEYKNDIEMFINFARSNIKDESTTRSCPCRRCCNKNVHELNSIKRHLIINGFDPTCIPINHHVKSFQISNNDDQVDGVNDRDTCMNDNNDDIFEMLDDIVGPELVEEIEDDSSVCENLEKKLFDDIFQATETELYPGCQKFSMFSFLIRLMHIKVLNNWTNKSFDMLLELWKDALPQDSNVPHFYYEAKRLMRNLGYENIHMCKYDCILFWKEHKNAVVCPTCGELRFLGF